MDILSFLSILLTSVVLLKAEMEGQVRLTGLNSNSSGRVEIFLNGKWGTVSRKLKNSSTSLHLPYGETICHQINHFNGDNSVVLTGTVSSLNSLLENENNIPINDSDVTEGISMVDLNCETHTKDYPQHVLRCSYSSSTGFSGGHENDLAVICDMNASNSDHPYIGQIRLSSTSSTDGTNQGVLEIYAGTSWGNVCYGEFDKTAANTACRQLGYTSAKSFNKTKKKTASTTWLESVSCGKDDSSECLWSCVSSADAAKLYSNITKTCDNNYYVAINCEFDVNRNSTTSSPYIGNMCQVPPYAGASNERIIVIISVLCLLMFLVSLISGILMCICCFCIPTCLCFKLLNKEHYDKIDS